MPSSRMTALLALLAVAGYQNRHRLAEMFQNATGQSRPSADDRSGIGGHGQSGGLLDSLLGGGAAAAGGGLLGGLLGGSGSSRAGEVTGGLGDLLEQFTGSGQADVAKSWVGTGPNREIESPQLEQALGEDTIAALTQQTGLSREDLLARLKTVLPTAVDKLTPDGHLPSEAEAARWV